MECQIQLYLFLSLQEFRVPGDLMELAIPAIREFLENKDLRETLVNGEAQGLQECVIFQCVIRPTTSGNITAKDPTSEDTAVWERLLSWK